MKLHPKYGVNPTIPLCWWCGEAKNEVALLGAAYKDEAPMHMVLDHNPCEKCVERMAQGITLIEAADDHGKPTPTGRWCVVTEDAARRAFTEPMLVLEKRKAFVTPEAWALLGVDKVAPTKEAL